MITKPEYGFDPSIEKWEGLRERMESMLKDAGMARDEAAMLCMIIAARMLAMIGNNGIVSNEIAAARKRRSIIDMAENFLRTSYDTMCEKIRHGPGI